MAPLGISSRSVFGIAQRSPSTRADGSRKEASGASRTRCRLGQQAAVRLLRVGRAGDDDQDGEHADRRGQAGAQQPAEAAALARVGMVADVDVAERAAGAAEIGMRAGVRLAVAEMDASATQRCVALGVHPPCRSPSLTRAGERRIAPGSRRFRAAPCPAARRSAARRPPGATAGDEPSRMSLQVVCALQCGPFCGKQGVAATRDACKISSPSR